MDLPCIGLTPEHFMALVEQAPIPISIYDHTGLQVAINPANAKLFGLRREDTIGHFNMVTDPQLAPSGSAENHRRVMQGETVVLPPHAYNAQERWGHEDALGERWVEAVYSPLRDASGTVTHLVAMLRDVTNEIAQKKAIAAAQAEIASQRVLIESLSTPVVQVWEGILAMPLVGTIDSGRAMQVTESLLTEIVEQQAECVIIDITGIPLVDTQVAQYLIQTAQASKLLGCEVALVGIGVEMAQTLVQLGVDLSAITTLANLQAGIAWAFTRYGMQVVNAA
ncbi:MAG: PAS domain S-box protein [Chloroflexi bacterium]|nr:PAS domain S-box protein [Chloroflexota bacterium]